jgi:hypothetical protein
VRGRMSRSRCFDGPALRVPSGDGATGAARRGAVKPVAPVPVAQEAANWVHAGPGGAPDRIRPGLEARLLPTAQRAGLLVAQIHPSGGVRSPVAWFASPTWAVCCTLGSGRRRDAGPG